MALRCTKYGSRQSRRGARDWGDLPCELIVSIFEHIIDDYRIDLRRAASVCVAWRRAGSLINSKKPSITKLPCICTCRAYDDITNYCFCRKLNYDSVLKQSRYYFFISPASTRTQTRVWLIRAEEIDTNRWLLRSPSSSVLGVRVIPSGLEYNFNLLDEYKILGVAELNILYYVFNIENELNDPFKVCSDWTLPYVRKVISMSDLGIVLVLFDCRGKLALWSEDSEWSYLHTRNYEFADIINLRDELYALDTIGRLVMINPTTFDLVEVASSPKGIEYDDKFMYLVCCDEFLYFVYIGFVGAETWWKHSMNFGRPQSHIEVRPVLERDCRLVFGEVEDVGVFMFDKKTRAWVRVENLGDKVFFITSYATFSVTAKQIGLCQGSFICFICDDFDNVPGFGKFPIIYKVEGNVCRKQEDLHSDITVDFGPPPNWIRPMLHSSRKLIKS